MREIQGEFDREKGSGDVEEGGVLWLQGIIGAGLASSLAGNRILNGCLLALSRTHTPLHTHTPFVSSCPLSDSSLTLCYSELHQSILSLTCVTVCPQRPHKESLCSIEF